MMLTLTENYERDVMPSRTREQAARLLEDLRVAYRTLSTEDRGQVKGHFAKLARVQFTLKTGWEK